MTKEDGAPADDWVVQTRKRERPEEGWKYAYHYKAEQDARDFMRGYPVLWPDEEWRIVRQVTTWEVVK